MSIKIWMNDGAEEGEKGKGGTEGRDEGRREEWLGAWTGEGRPEGVELEERKVD